MSSSLCAMTEQQLSRKSNYCLWSCFSEQQLELRIAWAPSGNACSIFPRFSLSRFSLHSWLLRYMQADQLSPPRSVNICLWSFLDSSAASWLLPCLCYQRLLLNHTRVRVSTSSVNYLMCTLTMSLPPRLFPLTHRSKGPQLWILLRVLGCAFTPCCLHSLAPAYRPSRFLPPCLMIAQ